MSATNPTTTHMPPLPLPLAGRSVVVIEDRPSGRRAYADAFREAGALVLATDQANAAGEPVPGLSPADAVVLIADRTDPGDLEAMRTLRDEGFRGLILAVTEDWSREAAAEWARFGADDCLPKPADPNALPGPIADYLLRSRNETIGIVSPVPAAAEEPRRTRREVAAGRR